MAEPTPQHLEPLIAEVSAALADAVDMLRQKKDAAEEVAASLSELVEAMREHAGAGSMAIAEALKALRIESPPVTVENTVNVQPTPVEVKAHIAVQPTPVESHNHITVQPPATERPREFAISHVEYDSHNRITGARIRVVPPTGR